jgi:D-psicose/D-tagatose/L-ribulose 3-epimerase
MQIGCHGSVWTGTFDTAGLELAIAQTQQAGFDIIEIPMMDPDEIDRVAVRRLLERYGLGATASLGLGFHNDLSSEDAEVSAAGETLLRTCLEVLGDIGGTHLVGVIYSAMGKYAAQAGPLNRKRSIDAIGRLGERGREIGVRLGIEVVNRYETNLVNTSRQAVEYVDEVADDNVTVHLDTYHMNIEEPDMFSPVLTAGNKLGYVHIGESHRGYLGSGTVDFDSFFHALGHVGYDGPIVFESFSSAVVHKDFSTMLAIWRNLWVDGADLASHANAFIRGHLRSVASVGMH